jgi:PPOX class probable F420-dependent enzyme
MAAADSTQMDPTGLDAVIELARPERFLGVVSTLRADGTIQSSLLNVGVMAHPFRAGRVLAFVTYGKVKLANLRARPQITVTFRAGWNWITVEGTAEIIGPDDLHPAVDADGLRLLLREIFTEAGGTHDDWPVYDQVMVDSRRSAVLIAPTRIYGNKVV